MLFSLYPSFIKLKSKMSKSFSKMSQEELAQHFPTFINNSGLPIDLETWQNTDIYGLETMQKVLVKSGEQIVLPSINGEWYLETYLDKKYADEWIAQGLPVGERVGKFRNKPCYRGDYSWMSNDNSPFDIVYDAEKRTATFIKK